MENMMLPTLRLCEDVLSNDGELALPAHPRMIFVVHGAIAVVERILRDEETFSGEGAVTVKAGESGATLWRWEYLPDVADRDSRATATAAPNPDGRGVVSRQKLAAPLQTLPQGALVLRGDSVAFPPGGCAYLHRHQGPGIRCLIEGGIRIETRGHSASYGPGGAWYETGPDGVFAQAADRPTRFIRVMILPRACLGKSSIEYLNEQDKAKPKSQSYKIFADMPIRNQGSGIRDQESGIRNQVSS
jgi:hypothetical protein